MGTQIYNKNFDFNKFFFIKNYSPKFFSKKKINFLEKYENSYYTKKSLKKFTKKINVSSKSDKNHGIWSEKSVFFSRRVFLFNFLGFWLFNSVILCYNKLNFVESGDKMNFFFDFVKSQEYEKKNNLNSVQKEFGKQISPFISKKEKNIEELDKILRVSGSIFLIGAMVTSGISLSERSSKKIVLPEFYSPNQIKAYYKLRPEKIFTRFSQIFIEVSKLTFGLLIDYIVYPKKEYKKDYILKEKAFQEFFISNYNSLMDIFNFFFSKKISNFTSFFLKTRLLNIIQLSLFRSNQKKKKLWRTRWDSRAKQVRETIGKLSPAFVKLAQALASRPDLVDERIARELQRLQDDMPFFPNKEAFKFIKQELGATPEKIFSKISDEPVAAASLGQVYKATLDGIQVAIKVQRPGLLDQIALDIFVIRFLANFTQNLFKFKTDLVSIVDEYAERLFEELDYRKESSNMIKFRSLYGYMDMIYIPRVFLEYSSKHVLVIEWVEGERLIKNSSKTMQEDVSLIEIGVRCSLVQLLETGFLHCDPHGGNLIKTTDGRLAYLDFGLVSEIPETVRYSLISAILNLINREYESLARDFNGMALIRGDDLDQELLKISDAFFETFDKSLSNFDKFTFQDISEKIFRLTVDFPFVLPPYFLNNLRAIATLEGLALTADPKFKIADVIYPYIINKLLTNSAPQFQASLEDFLIDKGTGSPNWDRLEALLQDPEWTETFSEQSVNLSDTLLNFILSPPGKFLKNLILKSFLEKSIKKILIFFDFATKKTNFYKSGPKNTNQAFVQLSSFQDSLRNNKLLLHNLRDSKIYNLNTMLILIQTCIFSTLILISELSFKFLTFFFELFIQKYQNLPNFPIRFVK